MNGLAKVEVWVRDEEYSECRVTCGDGKTFDEVMRGLELAKNAIQSEIDNWHKCPMAKTRFERPT